jgi:hypothetical protein
MAGITTDIATGQIDKGDTKTFRVSATDDRGERLKLDSITLEIDVEGAVTTLTKSDFSVSDKVYTTKHTFQNAGTLQLDVSVTDDPNLDSERETESSFVHA